VVRLRQAPLHCCGYDEGRTAYLAWLGDYCTKYKVSVLAYCLMTNHIHVVAIPESEEALEKVFRPLHTRYAQRVNRAKRWKGHLWQGRFFSSALDETYLWAAIRYVERNPVRARVVRRARPLYSHSAVQPVEEIRRDLDARLARLHRAANRIYDHWTAGLARD
jgi:REP element-mobilizing transposase RayT